MNAEEKLRVARLVTRLVRQPEAPQDEDAALELAALLKVRPDAPYLLMQRTLMLELALERAQAELEQLRQAQAQAQSQAQAEPRNPYQANAGYEPSLPAPSASRAPQQPAGGWQPGVSTGPAIGNNPSYGPAVATGAAPSAAGGFLRNAAAVGAGVLGGSLLFHGLDSLFHNHGGGGHQSSGLLDQGAGAGLLSGDMQAPLDAISGSNFLDPANDPLAGGGADPFSGDMLGDGGELDDGGDDWA